MSYRVVLAVTVLLLVPTRWADAQDVGSATTPTITTPVAQSALETLDRVARQPLILPAAAQSDRVVFGAPTPVNPFTSVGHDLKHFFSKDTAMVMGVFAPVAGMAYSWDQAGIEESQEILSKRVFEPGNIAGSFAVQAGAALGTWTVGKMTGNAKTTTVGADLVRAQIVSQVLVQGIKFATGRERPDASNNHSFPSGHTASAFATASVLGRHLGPKYGVPAYAFATYVGLARLSAKKHHMSDVIMGAGIGIAAGRTVTMSVGRAKFDLGVAPTQGGAAVMFTKR